MFQCKYCGTMFRNVPEDGGCTHCGGPELKDLNPNPTVIFVIPSGYTHHTEQDYYTPQFRYHPLLATRSSFYGELGYKWASVIIVVFVCFVIWQIDTTFFTSTPPAYNGPTIATVQPTRQFIEPTQPFSPYQFCSASESEMLRSAENVINIAVIGDGYGVRYMTDKAIILDKNTWRETAQIFGVSGLSTGETTCTMTINNVNVTLNKQQGFILANRPGTIYVIDYDNSIWMNDLTSSTVVGIVEAQTALSSSIPANPLLPLTLK